MARILIKLSPDRTKCGALTLEDAEGQMLSGPFLISSRASDGPAREHQNESRNPLMRYGDTPTGIYRVSGILKSGDGTAYSSRQYGSNGVIVLDPVSGDAALADANGRYHIFIQGGAAGRGRKLRSTNGCLRLMDVDQAKLIEAIRDLGAIACDCSEDPTVAGGGTVLIDNSYNEGDPPAVLASDSEGGSVHEMKFSRRAVLRGAAMGAAAAAMQTISLGHTIFSARDERELSALGFEGVAMAYPSPEISPEPPPAAASTEASPESSPAAAASAEASTEGSPAAATTAEAPPASSPAAAASTEASPEGSPAAAASPEASPESSPAGATTAEASPESSPAAAASTEASPESATPEPGTPTPEPGTPVRGPAALPAPAAGGMPAQVRLHIYIRAFIPSSHSGNPGYIFPIPGAAGKYAIHSPLPASVDPGCFMTDNRSFSSDIAASSRVTTEFVLLISNTGVLVKEADGRPIHRTEPTHKVDCQTGLDLSPPKSASTSHMSLGQPALADGIVQVIVDGRASNPLAYPLVGSAVSQQLAPDIQYGGSFLFNTHSNTLKFDGSVKGFPAYEAYAQLNNGPVTTLFRHMPTVGTAGGLIDFGTGFGLESVGATVTL